MHSEGPLHIAADTWVFIDVVKTAGWEEVRHLFARCVTTKLTIQDLCLSLRFKRLIRVHF